MLAQSAVRSYQQNSVTTSDPLKLILLIYDRAIMGCQQKNLEIAGKAITELMRSLNMEAGPIAASLLAVYQYCIELARKGLYDEPIKILKELRETWAAVGGKSDAASGR